MTHACYMSFPFFAHFPFSMPEPRLMFEPSPAPNPRGASTTFHRGRIAVGLLHLVKKCNLSCQGTQNVEFRSPVNPV